MNPKIIKKEIEQKKGKKVKVIVYGMRNKKIEYEGIINGIYPNIFTIKTSTMTKSFTYADLITGDIKIKYT